MLDQYRLGVGWGFFLPLPLPPCPFFHFTPTSSANISSPPSSPVTKSKMATLNETKCFPLIEKLYQTLETVFHQLCNYLEFCQKHSAPRRIFNSLLGVWVSRWNTVSRVWYITRSLAFDKIPNWPSYHAIENTACRKTIVYSSVFHWTFPSISAIPLYHTQPSHLATVFSGYGMVWNGMQPFLVV